MPERIDASMMLRKNAERLREIARNETTMVAGELERMAQEMDREAYILEAAAIRDLDA
jgi:hypothetical protein